MSLVERVLQTITGCEFNLFTFLSAQMTLTCITQPMSKDYGSMLSHKNLYRL